eukprot:scaffold7250_cov131-Cylindrotheca_fusiformis.AAC.2
MVAQHVATINSFFGDVLDFIPPGLILSVAAGCIENRKYWDAYVKELVGTMMMIAFTFSAGKWIGAESWVLAWSWHAVGVVAADYFGGGQQVNPAVTVGMWALAEIDYSEACVRIAGQMGGGLISFPLFQIISDTLNLTPFGGPQFNKDSNGEAAISEFLAMFCLMWVNWEFNFGEYHYWIKQTLTAMAIRALIEFFPTAGPAMNPMLGTCWAAFGVGSNFEFPSENEHFFVYWVAPCLSSILAAATYGIYSGKKVFGKQMPGGPIKKTVTKQKPKQKTK